MKQSKYFAELITWTGQKVVQEIKKEFAESIASAVSGQYFFADNVLGFAIDGSKYSHVDIYEVKK